MTLSIIIPTLNEEQALPATLQSVADLVPQPLEVILVDGGSSDRTIELARNAGLKIVHGQPTGRASQMNAGAAIASGDHLCFLHADTSLPKDFVSLVQQTLENNRIALAGFVSIMRGPEKLRWFTTAHNFVKTWYAPLLFRPISFFKGCRLLFGDQVLTCRSSDFNAIKGFDPHQTVMEEADFCLRMSRSGRGVVRQINRKVWSSDRRVAEWGALLANCTYLYIGAMWGLGAKPDRLAEFYKDVR
ncbi:MAG: TIGR04283 family arsenosugar biosynthesis glycosyltransferase [Pseudomonadota bacterium]